MSKFIIVGGKRLEGTVRVDGAKNAVLPILAATVLNGGDNIIHDCPQLNDVSCTLEILKSLGCSIQTQDGTITVNSAGMNEYHIPDNLMRKMRSSIFFMGAILGRCGKAVISFPGGCEIGLRPIDLHLKALKQLGVSISESHGYIYCRTSGMRGTDIHLDFPSVGATENIMLAAVTAKGSTSIRNPAKEPEIIDLQDFLNCMGAKVSGAGSGLIRIEGVSKLHNSEHKIIPDRIVTATYLIAGAITGGTIQITNVASEHVGSVLSVLKECGCRIYENGNSVIIARGGLIKPIEVVRTMAYPGFPTDAQAPLTSLLTLAGGTSIIKETIFESRFKHVDELLRMGADVTVDGRVAVIRGVKKLSGAGVTAKELRGGAALVLAGLVAEGSTVVHGVKYIDRGYEQLENKLSSLGASIKRVN